MDKYSNTAMHFNELYEAYMFPDSHPGNRQEDLIGEMYQILKDYIRPWVIAEAKAYSAFPVDRDLALDMGCEAAYHEMEREKKEGWITDHPLGHFSQIAKYKTIDRYFRKEFGRGGRKPGWTTPIDENWPAGGEDEPIMEGQWERNEWMRLSDELKYCFIRSLMDYDGAPEKVLALIYSNCIFQYAKMDEDDPLHAEAAGSTAVSSARWAFRRMEGRTMRELACEVQWIMNDHNDRELRWGPCFLKKLAACADTVYTDRYDESQIRKWSESIMNSNLVRTARNIIRDGSWELAEFALEQLNADNAFCRTLERLKDAG